MFVVPWGFQLRQRSCSLDRYFGDCNLLWACMHSLNAAFVFNVKKTKRAFFSCISGCSGINGALLVGLKHQFPEKNAIPSVNLIKMKHLPAIVALYCLACLCMTLRWRLSSSWLCLGYTLDGSTFAFTTRRPCRMPLVIWTKTLRFRPSFRTLFDPLSSSCLQFALPSRHVKTCECEEKKVLTGYRNKLVISILKPM